MSVRETFKNNLRDYRKKNNLTQEELSEKIGLNLNYIADIESRAKFPTAENIDAIAAALDIHPAQLFLEQTTPVKIQLLLTKHHLQIFLFLKFPKP